MIDQAYSMFKGLLTASAPGFLKGALVKLLTSVTVAGAVEWVEKDYILFNRIPEKYRHELSILNLGKLDWLTVEWAIEAIKDNKPQLASLFLSWEKGHIWLECQCNIIKQELASVK